MDRAFCEDRVSKGYVMNQPDSMACMTAYDLDPGYPLADEPFLDPNWSKDETGDVHLLGGYTGTDSGSVRLAAVYLLCKEDKKAQGPLTRKRTVKTTTAYSTTAGGIVNGTPSFGARPPDGATRQQNQSQPTNYTNTPQQTQSQVNNRYTFQAQAQGVVASASAISGQGTQQYVGGGGAEPIISLMASSSVESVTPTRRRAPNPQMSPAPSVRRTQTVHRSASNRQPATGASTSTATPTRGAATDGAFDVHQMANMMEQMYTAINSINTGQAELREAVSANATQQNLLQEQVRTGFLAGNQSPRRRSRDEDEEEEVGSDVEGPPDNARQRYDTDGYADGNLVEDDGGAGGADGANGANGANPRGWFR